MIPWHSNLLQSSDVATFCISITFSLFFIFFIILLFQLRFSVYRHTVMVRTWSRSFRRTIKGQLWWSLRWWLSHHCSVPPLPPATLVRLILELHRNTPLLQYHQPNLHSYHCHYQPAPCAIYRSTTTAPPCSTHVPCSRPITSHTHQFSRSWVAVTTRTCEDLCRHPSAPSGIRVSLLYVHSTTICSSL